MAYQFQSKNRIESKAFPGVSFTVKKITEGRRIKLRLMMASEAARLRELSAERLRLMKEEDPDPKEVANLAAEVSTITEDTIKPAWVRWGLQKVEGLEVDGAPCETPEEVIESGPPELYQEILEAVQEAAGLSERVQGESGSPSTSPGSEDGETSGSTAGPVESPASI